LVERAVTCGFAHPSSLDLFTLVDSADEVFVALARPLKAIEEAPSA
jgi:hypothetical protein